MNNLTYFLLGAIAGVIITGNPQYSSMARFAPRLKKRVLMLKKIGNLEILKDIIKSIAKKIKSMNKNLREFLTKKNTAQDFTIDEVLEFTDSNIEWLATEYERTIALDKKVTEVRFSLSDLYSLIVKYKQLHDKLAEIKENEK